MARLPETLQTGRLLIRQFTLDDCDGVHAYASDPEVTRYMDWPRNASREVSLERIRHNLRKWEEDQDYAWAIATLDNPDQVIGSIGCDELSFKVSFGYVLARPAWGNGYATEAATALVDLLSQTRGVRRIWATCDCENKASARVLEKAGCTLEGTLRNWSVRPNLPGAPVRDSYVYAKTVDA